MVLRKKKLWGGGGGGIQKKTRREKKKIAKKEKRRSPMNYGEKGSGERDRGERLGRSKKKSRPENFVW